MKVKWEENAFLCRVVSCCCRRRNVVGVSRLLGNFYHIRRNLIILLAYVISLCRCHPQASKVSCGEWQIVFYDKSKFMLKTSNNCFAEKAELRTFMSYTLRYFDEHFSPFAQEKKPKKDEIKGRRDAKHKKLKRRRKINEKLKLKSRLH